MYRNTWVNLAVCKKCGSNLYQKDTHIVCVNCGEDHSTQHKWFIVTDGKLLDNPSIAGQVFSPSEQSIEKVAEFYIPAIQDAGIHMDNLRILEIGSGAGNIAYGFSKIAKPLIYMATDAYVQLLDNLRANLDDWGLKEPVGWVAGLNADLEIALRPQKFNVVIGHSVLHHILDYRAFIQRINRLLDAPGVLLFAEPLRDGWTYFLIIINFLLEQADILQLSETSRAILSYMRNNLDQRINRANDKEFLIELEDKHIFALDDLRDLAFQEGLDFYTQKIKTTALDSTILQLVALGISPIDLEKIRPFLKKIIPDVSRKDVEFAGFFTWLVFGKHKKKVFTDEQRIARKIYLDDLRESLSGTEQKLSQTEQKLSQTEQKLSQTEQKLSQTEQKLSQTEQKLLDLRTHASNAVKELCEMRESRVLMLVNRFRRTSLREVVNSVFQRFLDDSYEFQKMKGFLLQPSVNLQKVDFLGYRYEFNRCGLCGIWIAPLLDIPLARGVIGIELVSPKNKILVQQVTSVVDLKKDTPVQLVFEPIFDTQQGTWELRVFARDIEGPIRLLEWRKYSWAGLGKLRTRAFCAFDFV
jgi:ubiquinone/menaquinone biosynthesis C-methylase UbiE